MSDVGSLRELYGASHRRLVISLVSLTGDVDEAEECVSEAFARALRAWSRVSRYENPEAWVRLVAINIARSRWRAARRRASRGDGLRQCSGVLTPDHVALMTALRRLPQEQREAIVLHHLVDLSVEEVAVHQGAPVGTIKARLSRGRKALAALLAMEEEDVSGG